MRPPARRSDSWSAAIERTRSAGGRGEAAYLRGICLRGWDCKSLPLDTGVPHGHDEFEPAAPPQDMTLRNLSPSTQQSYVYAVANFSRHFGRSPDKLGLEQVRAYQLHLIGLKRSWNHSNQVTCALRFFICGDARAQGGD